MSSYLQLKKRAFMSIVNGVKGFVRSVAGVPPISLEDCVDSDSLIDWKLYGNSVQEGTPTPEAPVEVVSVGEYDSETGKYKIPVTARGKNLVDYKQVILRSGSSVEYIDNGFTYTGNYYFSFDASKLKIGKYTMSFDFQCSDALTPIWRIEYTDRTYSNSARSGISLEVTKSAKSILVYPEMSGTTYTSTFTNIQLETGTTATAYEPYHAPIKTNLYLDEPLRKVGDYADYVDFKNQKVVRKVFYTSLTEVFNKSTNGTQYATGLCRIQTNLLPKANYNIAPLSESMKGYSSSIKPEANCISLIDQYKNIYCYFSADAVGLEAVTETTSNKTIGTAIKQYIQDNEIDVYYVLAEETHTPISIPKLPTIKGTTIYEIGASLNASNMEATYYSSIKGE